MISASTAANPLLTETLPQLVQKHLDELSQKEHQLVFRMAQLMKNGLDQTCAVNGFSYSAPHCVKHGFHPLWDKHVQAVYDFTHI